MLESEIPLTGTPFLDHSSLGVHYYDSRTLDNDTDDFCPAHMDGGTLTILVRAGEGSDGLDIANLDSTEKVG